MGPAAGRSSFDIRLGICRRLVGISVLPASATVGLTCTAQNRTGVLAFHALGSLWRSGGSFVALKGNACAGESCEYADAFRVIRLA